MKYSMSVSKSRRRAPKRKGIPSLNNYNRIRKYNSKNVNKSRFQNRTVKGVSSRFNKAKIRKILYIIVGITFFIGCVALIAVGVYLKNMQNSLPSPDELVERTSDQSTQIFDREGLLLYTVYGNQNREFVAIEDIPEHTKWALLAAVDIEFTNIKDWIMRVL